LLSFLESDISLSFLHCSEVIEAARKKEEYQRRHMAGETEGAQREIAQLAIVKKRREAAAK
jgi:Casein kinase substrate phosphoprotein PP28